MAADTRGCPLITPDEVSCSRNVWYFIVLLTVNTDMEEKKMEVSNDTLVAFMKSMQVNVDKISAEIKMSNKKLGKEIKEGREEFRSEMEHLNKKIDNVSNETEKLKNEMRN